MVHKLMYVEPRVIRTLLVHAWKNCTNILYRLEHVIVTWYCTLDIAPCNVLNHMHAHDCNTKVTGSKYHLEIHIQQVVQLAIEYVSYTYILINTTSLLYNPTHIP